MNHRRHVVPTDVFDALAAGGGGARAAELLIAGQRSKRLLLHRALLDRSRVVDPELHRELARDYGLLARIQRHSEVGAEAVERVTGYPAVGGWAATALRALAGGDAKLPGPGYLSTVAAAAAVRAGTELGVSAPVNGGHVVFPSLGTARVAPVDYDGVAMVRGGPDDAWIEAPGAVVPIGTAPGTADPRWTPVPRVSVTASDLRLTVLLDDVDAFNLPVRGQMRRLSPPEVARWRTMLGSAWSLLAQHHRAHAAEISALVTVLVPLAVPGGRQTSSTTRDAFGAIALSEPPDATSFAVTLVHEVQHLKLGALLDLVPLLDDSGDRRWYAPWRDDPRPLSGLLQGAYAHLGITSFWRRQRWLAEEPAYGQVQFAWWREQTWQVIQTLLTSGRLTPAGHVFVKRMRMALEPWLGEPVPGDVVDRARALADRHRRTWEHRHGAVERT